MAYTIYWEMKAASFANTKNNGLRYTTLFKKCEELLLGKDPDLSKPISGWIKPRGDQQRIRELIAEFIKHSNDLARISCDYCPNDPDYQFFRAAIDSYGLNKLYR